MRDMVNMLTDDELGLILNRVVDSNDRKSASLVCKKWLIVEGQTRSSITVLRLDLLPRLLVRFTNLVAFRTSEPITSSDQLKLVAKACPKLETFVLDPIPRHISELLELTAGMETRILASKVGDEGLCCIANGCLKLSKIVFKLRVLGIVGLKSLITSPAGHNLSHLKLSYCSWVSDQMFEAIGSSKSPISVLILESTNITDAGLAFLTDGYCSKTIKHLDLSWCQDITDSGILLLHKMCVLEELNLIRSKLLTDVGGVAISAVSTLKKLELQGLGYLTDRTVVALAQNCPCLEILNLNFNTRVFTGAGIRSFCGHKHLECLELVKCMDYISGYDVERLVLGCPTLKTIRVEEGLRVRLLHEMEASTVSRLIPTILR